MQTALIHADMADFLLLFQKIFPSFRRKVPIPWQINLLLLPGGQLETIITETRKHVPSSSGPSSCLRSQQWRSNL